MLEIRLRHFGQNFKLLTKPGPCSFFRRLHSMNSEKGQVYLSLKKGNSTEPAKFYDCILEYFNPDSEKQNLELSYNGVSLTLSEPGENSKDVAGIRHSFMCPFKHLPTLEEAPVFDDKFASKGINVAVAVVIESSDNHVLLTQRASTLRVSPNIWVPPGGHLDKNESLYDCGFREVQEETGLDIKKYAHNTRILTMWEAAYPLALAMGEPRSHVLVLYLHTKVPKTHKEITKCIQMNPSEVQAITWLNHSHLEELSFDGKCSLPCEILRVENDILVSEPRIVKNMFAYEYWRAKDVYYAGVQCALQEWYIQCSSKL